jgi:DNA excision repair protein ERCC-4
LLILHFPRLRLVWSRSLHATKQLFFSFKSNFDEPDAAVAAAVGVPTDAQVWTRLRVGVGVKWRTH